MVDVNRMPIKEEEQTFHSWQVKCSQSHILHSKCSKSIPCKDDTQDKCSFCIFNRQLDMPHLPDMVFPNNTLSIKHTSGCEIHFNALDALKKVANGKVMPLEISCANSWKESRMESGHMDKVVPFDWTFSTDYSGSIQGSFQVTETDQRIDLDKLRRKETIMFYQDITLFEDELHDNGIALCNVKMRVMPSGFFVLLRYFLRVDNVMLRINDTRVYHEFDTDFVLREFTSKEAKVVDLQVPPSLLIEPSEVAELLPLVKSCYEKLTLPAVNKVTAVDSA